MSETTEYPKNDAVCIHCEAPAGRTVHGPNWAVSQLPSLAELEGMPNVRSVNDGRRSRQRSGVDVSETTSVRGRGRLPGGEHLFEPWEAREIRDRYRAGESGTALARAYSASARTIALILRGEAGYSLDPGEVPVPLRTSAEEVARIASRNRATVRALHAQGKTAAEVADESGLSVLTVQNIASELRLRWPRKPVPVAHGTLRGYRRCGPPRCDACKAANTEKMRQYLAKKRRAA